MARPAETNWSQRLAEQVRRNPGRVGVLGILLALMGFLWARNILPGGGPAGPATAEAAGHAAAPAGAAAAARQMPDAVRRLQEWLRAPITPAGRNIFAVRLDYFPRAGAATAKSVEPAGGGFWEQLEKSLAVRADEQRARRILVENLKAAAARLDLQSTMLGEGAPRALVNGTLVGEGDAVEGFRVLKIEPRRIIVEREGVRFEVLFSRSR